MRRKISTWLTLAFLMMSLATFASAQSAGTGSISGTVKDPGGLVVPGAQVTVKNLDTGTERTFTTSDTGLYAVPYLQPGRYEVRVKKDGFADVIRQNLRLEVGQTLVVDIQLPLRTATETVTVTSEVGLVDTEKIDVSQTINQDMVENLPLNGRRWDNLALLTPGASEDGGFGGISFRGINSLYNNNMVDGADNNQAFFSEARGRTRIGYGYSINSIKEFQVQTAVYSAEYGRAAGGVVNAVTRSGGNDWHGDFFYFIRDKAFLARDPVANASGQPKPDERRQQFGGSFSGPLVQDKLFFFLNYDQQKRNFPAVIVPFRSNFFDGPVGSNTSNSGSQVQRCTNPNCPAVIAALDTITNTTNPRKGDQWLGLAKLDYEINPNNSLSGVFNILRWDSPNGILTGPVLTSTALSNGADIVKNEFITVTWRSVLRPTIVNEARFQYGRDFEAQTPNASGPQVQISDAANFGMPNFLPRGAFPNEKRFQWVDNVSWLVGRHEWKFGLDINHVRDKIQNLFQGGGIYRYFNSTGNGALNKFVSDLSNGTRQYADFVQAVDPITGDGSGFFTTNDYNFYVQDKWKLHTNFTLYFGLRYEVQDMPSVAKANPAVPETATLNTDTNNFGPRVGFAWGLGAEQKGVIRGGYGLYYGRTQNSSIFIHLFQNGVFQQLFTFRTSDCGAPLVPNTVFPQPSTVGPNTPLFGSTGPTGTNMFQSLDAFLLACPSAQAGSSVVDVLDPTFVNPLAHQYDIAYERELPWKLGLTLSYVGSRGNRLPVFVDANLPAPDTTRDYAVLDSSDNATGQVVTVPFFSGAVSRPNSNAGVILMGKSVLNSWYSGLVVRVRRRESKGFSFDANYTWSKAWDNGQVAGVNGTFAGTNSPINPYDLKAEYGLSDLDIRNRFIFNTYWVLPFGNWTDSTAGKAILDGWRASSVWRIQDGRPVQTDMGNRPSCSFDGGLSCGAISSFGSSTNSRAPVVTRNTNFATPALISFDLRIAREFRLTESSRLEFLWEAFNLFNRTQALSVDTRAFFLDSATSSPCSTFSTGPTFGGCLSPNSGFMSVRSTGNTLYGARQMQFGLKFSF